MTTGHPITAPDQALQFMLAGKATFTVKSEVTGEHLTFQVRHWKKAKDATLHFVSVRTGNDYAKIGMVRDRRYFNLGKQIDLDVNDKRVRGFRYVFDHLVREHRMPPKCEVWHEGACGKCGRPLTDPVSIARGIGPECIKKMECV